jgi:2-dehydro-3-deoxygluconokinase
MNAPNTQRVVTFGELLLRLSPPRYEQFFETPQLAACFGGCEANVAVGLCHLGLASEYVTVLPKGAIGDAALDALRTEGVGTGAVQRGGERLGIYYIELGTGQRATRVVYDRAHSAFSNVAAHAFHWTDILAGASWFHGSGITPALGDGPAGALASAIAAAHAAGVPVSMDLNYRPALWKDRDPRPVIEPLLRGTQLIIGNAPAVRAMLGGNVRDDTTATTEGARTLAHDLATRFGAKRVALTRRVLLSESEHTWSASLYDAASRTFAQSRTHHVQVVDRVGGGDSFAAALIASLLRAESIEHAVEFAVVASAHKLTIPGDFNRISTAEVERMLVQWS